MLHGDFSYKDLGLRINLDYLMSLNGHGDVFGIWWDRRNADLRFVLTPWQYDKYVALNHFYRPTVTAMQVISDADKNSVLPLHMPFKKDTGNSQKMGVPFSHVKHELCSLRAYTIIVCWYRELVDKHVNLFLLQILGNLQIDGHPSLIIAQIPDALSQNGIHHRPDFILSAPNGIKVSHRTIFAFWRLSKSLQKSDSSDSLKPLEESS